MIEGSRLEGGACSEIHIDSKYNAPSAVIKRTATRGLVATCPKCSPSSASRQGDAQTILTPNGGQWFRPWPHGSAEDLIHVYEAAKLRGLAGVEMMFHSSELMPGGSPFWPDEAAVERLYAMLTRLFEHAAKDNAHGLTLRRFAEDYLAARARLRGQQRWAA